MSIRTTDIMNDLKKFGDFFDFINPKENHEIFSNRNEKVVGKCKIETPKCLYLEKSIILTSKGYAFECNDKTESKRTELVNLIRKKYEPCYNCSFWREYQKDCDCYKIRSINHEIYLQKVTEKS